MSSKQYVNRFDGAVCPVCRSSDIISGGVDADGSVGTSGVSCTSCQSTWTDVWVVTQYTNLVIVQSS